MCEKLDGSFIFIFAMRNNEILFVLVLFYGANCIQRYRAHRALKPITPTHNINKNASNKIYWKKRYKGLATQQIH